MSRAPLGLWLGTLLLLAACGAPAAPTATPGQSPVASERVAEERGSRGAGEQGSGEPSAGAVSSAPPLLRSSAPSPAPTGTAAPRAGKLKVVTTVAPITNIVRNVGGDTIDLVGIVPEGTDSHTFEPSPADAKTLAEADLIIVNGLHLEEPTEKLAARTMKRDAQLLRLGDNTITRAEWVFDFSFPEDQGDPNPHLWMNVAYSMKYAELTRDALVTLDAANATTYRKNAETYLALLDHLDRGIATAIKTIPEANRKLLTYHDSWPYFARRYGLTVIGAIQPADFAEPSAREVAAIVDQLKQEQVPAIFGSEVFPSKVLDQIAREAKVSFVDTLRDDDLPGARDAPEHTYVGMMLANVRTMATALGGNAEALKGVDPKDVV